MTDVADFRGTTLVGSWDPTPPIASPSAIYWGLTFEAEYLYGAFRSTDGTTSAMARRVATAGDSSGLLLMRSGDGADLRADPAVAMSAWRGVAAHKIAEGEATLSGGGPPGMPTFTATLTRDAWRWEESSTWDLQGTAVGPGMKWFGPRPGGGVFWLSRLFIAQGTILGEPVQGFMGFDQCFMPPGTSWHDPSARSYEKAWYTWGNLYDDGTVETGHFAVGFDGWGFALVNGLDGPITACANVAADVEWDGAGWPVAVDFDIDGVSWTWAIDDGGRMPDCMVGERDNPQTDGRMRRTGDDRVPVAWFAWGDATRPPE